jgi:homoserine dehydrogenase
MGISLESIVQRTTGLQGDVDRTAGDEGPSQPVILITYETTEADIRAALALVEADNVIDQTPQLIRIEQLF